MRKNYFIDFDVQSKIIVIGYMLVLIIALITIINISIIFKQVAASMLGDMKVKVFIADLFKRAFENYKLAIFLIILINSFITIVILLFLSHKVAGPIVNIKKNLKRILKGNLNVKIQLRENDFFGEIADLINKTTKQLNRHVIELKTRVENIKNLTSENEEFKALISDEISSMEKILNSFQT